MFKDELGLMDKFNAKHVVKPEARPRFCQPRPVPFAMKDAVDRELERLEDMGVLEKVTHSDWAAPIVAIPKGNGDVQLCGDYKVTVNPVLDMDQYPFPCPDLMSNLTGGLKFSKLDLTSTYQ